MTSKTELQLPVFSSRTASEVCVVGACLGDFNPFECCPRRSQIFHYKGRKMPCSLIHDEELGPCVYWLKVARTYAAMEFDRDPRRFEREIYEDTGDDFWCVELYNMRSEITGQGYGTLVTRLNDLVLQQIANHNRKRLYAYMEDGSETGWTTALVTSFGFQVGERISQSDSLTVRLARTPLYKWYNPQ